MTADSALMTPDNVDAEDRNEFYRSALSVLSGAGMPFMVGGSYALERLTGIARKTKDIDIFVLPRDCRRVLDVLGTAGYGVELHDPSWLAKAFHHRHLLDIVFNSGNGMCPVDEEWFAHAPEDEVLGVRVKLGPVEESIWQKAFIMERERYDGADVIHMILHCGRTLDWERLLRRFGDNWQVLLSHLTLFQYSFPSETDIVPRWVMRDLLTRMDAVELSEARTDRLCRGTLLSRYQYLTDIESGDYRDARLISSWGEAA
jgi:hypothetical protein